jgi:monolysocardiolipin acyltransferase
MRWSLGSYDLCYKNGLLAQFFFKGQVLPTHRLKHSPLGGLFQPTIREAVRLLSNPYPTPAARSDDGNQVPNPSTDPSAIQDPFTTPTLTYTTTGADIYPSPSSYIGREYSWIHIFPEGRVHQHPHRTMRYFKWGVARLILEPDVCPDIVPMWIEGYSGVFPEDREILRPLPRPGQRLGVWFGENVAGAHAEEGAVEDKENVFANLRRRWKILVERDRAKRHNQLLNNQAQVDDIGRTSASPDIEELGTLSEDLMYGAEAVALRMECTREVRKAVLELRRKRGLPDEDPKAGLVETWVEEGDLEEGRKKDGSLVGRT